MKKMNYKKIYYICFLIYSLFLSYSLYDNIIHHYSHSMMMSFVSLALLFVVPILFKVLKWKPVYEIYILALIFMFLASLLGSAFRFYDHIPYWDKYVHAFSGVLGTLLSYFIFCLLKKRKDIKKEDQSLMYVFIASFNITIATLWELFEYAGLVFFDYDGIRHYVSGVHDSMTDIIVCIMGSLIPLYYIYRYYKTGKSNIFVSLIDTFYEVNNKDA